MDDIEYDNIVTCLNTWQYPTSAVTGTSYEKRKQVKRALKELNAIKLKKNPYISEKQFILTKIAQKHHYMVNRNIIIRSTVHHYMVNRNIHFAWKTNNSRKTELIKPCEIKMSTCEYIYIEKYKFSRHKPRSHFSFKRVHLINKIQLFSHNRALLMKSEIKIAFACEVSLHVNIIHARNFNNTF